MRSGLLLIPAVLLTSAATVGAQSRAETGTVATLSATGCLQRYQPDAAAVDDPVGGRPPAGVEYVLVDIEGRAPAPASAERPTAPPVRYLLLGAKGVDYAPHVNHKVKINGTIAPQPSTGASPAQQAADPATAETNLPPKAESVSYRDNLVDVTELTMVSRECGAK